MLKSYQEYINEGFTMDDEMIAHYLWLFKQPNANKIISEDNEEEMYRDIDMWYSLSENDRKYILLNSKFTGFIKDDRDLTDYLEIYKSANSKDLFYDIDGHLMNYCSNNGNYDADGWDQYYIKYKGEKNYISLREYDFENCEHLHYHQRGYKNFIDKINVDWIFDDSNYRYYIHTKTAISEILSEMDSGLKYYYNGKRLK